MRVRDVIKLIEADGWHLARTRGSHRQFKNPFKKGLVTIAGNQDADVMPKTLKSILRQAGIEGVG
jgi:predicted RNA binding protein YcfA (HicA-like mRNA interferase family)